MGSRGVALSPVIVSRDSHSAGSPEKACPGSTCHICGVCGGGVWGSLRWGLGSRESVQSEESDWTRPAICHSFIDLAPADHRANIQFLSPFRQSFDVATWTSGLPPSNSFDCLGISAGFPPRRVPH